jgi:hypothetical protein
MMTWIRIFVCCLALFCGPASANWLYTPGSGPNAFFSFNSGTTPAGTALCAASNTDCTATVPINTAGAALFVTGNAGLVTGTGGTFPVTQATAANLNATVIGTGTFATQAAQSGTWNIGTVASLTGALPAGTNSIGGVTVASGANVVEGTQGDPPCTVPTSTANCTINAVLKGLTNTFSSNVINNPTPFIINFAGGGGSAVANAIDANPGVLSKVYCYNPNAAVAFIQIYNLASGSVTPGSTAPIATYGIPATNAGGYADPIGDNFTTAISASVTTTYNGGTAPTTAVPCTVAYH